MLWKEIAKLELLSGSTRIALPEPNRFLNRKEPNRRGTDTTRTALRFFFTFLKPNEPKRTAGSLLYIFELINDLLKSVSLDLGLSQLIISKQATLYLFALNSQQSYSISILHALCKPLILVSLRIIVKMVVLL